jgi:hypothetical protein
MSQLSTASAPRTVWLASYPRSGNTLLRIILRHCFKLYSASVYRDDLSGIDALEDQVGHIEHGPAMDAWLETSPLVLLKTHNHPDDDWPAIYVLRDGRDACVSLWELYRRRFALDGIIAGQHRFGTWADHVAAWHPWDRPDTLLLRYEELVTELPGVLRRISVFLGVEIVSDRIPSRNDLAALSRGRVRPAPRRDRNVLRGRDEALFERVNGAMMRRVGYAEPTLQRRSVGLPS